MTSFPLAALLILGYGPPGWHFPWWLWLLAILYWLYGTGAQLVVNINERNDRRWRRQ